MQPVPSSVIKTNFPKDRESVLQELYIRKPTESTVLSVLGNLVWRGRILAASELLCTARKDYPHCPEISIHSAHLALIKGRGLLAYKFLEEALCSHPEHLGIRMLWAYVASLDKVLRLIPPKHSTLANIEKTFSKDPDTKAALNYLVKSDAESALILAQRAKTSDSSWLRYIYLSAPTGETYEQKKPYYVAFSQEKLVYPPFLAASILADMLQHQDYQTLRCWLSHNMTLPYDVPAIGIVIFLLEIIEGNEEASRNVKNRLLEQSPDPEITSALFIGSEKCELIIENLLPDLAQRAIHGLKELADILYDLRHFDLAEKCYKLCAERFPNDSVIWHRLGYAASYGDADDATIEAYFSKSLREATSKKELTAAYSAIGLAAIRQRNFKKAVHYLVDGINSPTHLYYLGYASLRLGENFKAADYLTFSLVQDEKNPRTRYLLGMISLARKDVKKAKEHFIMALSANQMFSEAHIELARLAVAEKAYLIAQTHIDIALIYEFENPVCWDIKGSIYLAQNKIEEAHTCFSMQFKLDFLDGQASLNLAETYFRKDQPEMALNFPKSLHRTTSAI
jgi:tetratricopeptide (TPR) repeat protein